MTVVHDWNHVDSHCVNGCVHHSWPHFQGRDFEECHHRVEDVIVVVDWDYPFSLLTFPSDFHAISIDYIHLEPPMALAPIYDHCAIWQFMIITVSKFTHEQLNSKNTEDHEEEEHNKQDIKKGWNREEKTIDHCLDSLVLGNHSEGLKALKALKPLMKLMSAPAAASMIHVRILNITMMKSRMFQLSLR